MVVVKIKDKQFYIDGYTKKNLDFVKERLSKRNETHVGIIDGRIGTGKSTLVDQLAYYCSDGNFTLKDKAFTVKDFSDILQKKEKGEAANNVVLDEAFELNRRRSNSFANMKILKQLQRIRSKNLWIWIVLPSVYDLDKNIILNLASAFFHCYTDYDFGEKGRYMAYNRHQLKRLWLYCRDSLSYYDKYAKASYWARFTSKFLSSDYDEYEKVKNAILDESDKEPVEKTTKTKLGRDALIKFLVESGFKKPLIAEKVKMDLTSINRIIKKKS